MKRIKTLKTASLCESAKNGGCGECQRGEISTSKFIKNQNCRHLRRQYLCHFTGGKYMIHQYRMGGYNIVLDTCSGSIHSVDEVAYDIISMYPENSREDIVKSILEKYVHRDDVTEDDVMSCIDDIEFLKAEGKLYTPDTFAEAAGTFKERSKDVIKALCLHVAHTCNLNCSYCFASQGKYHGQRALMSLETGKRALDFLIENSGDRTNLEVDFFGG